MNFVIILNQGNFTSWLEYGGIALFGVIYIALIMMAICEPTKPLKAISKEELEDHEYDRIEILELGESQLNEEIE